MSDLHRPVALTANNERSLKNLAWAIEACQGQFKLIFARCNYASLRERLVERLQELCSVKISILVLKQSDQTLYATIKAAGKEKQPVALMVLGLESVLDIDRMLTSADQVREEFRKNFHFPLVLWVNDQVQKKLMEFAPNLESWGTSTEFAIDSKELTELIKHVAEQFFAENLNREEALKLEAEIKAAQKDLRNQEQILEPELEANLESILGFAKDINNQKETALEHYQRGLELWRQIGNLEKQGQLLGDITFCYYLKALQHQQKDHPDWQIIQYYLQQSLQAFEQAKRPDLVANSIAKFGRILRQIQDWEQLKTLAEKALAFHQTRNRAFEIAQDYGFLAEVALAQEQWIETKQLAQKALSVYSTLTSHPRLNEQHSRCRFIMARTQQHLKQYQEAIINLEVAGHIGHPLYNRQLYLDILRDLQKLYFQSREYLKAFEIKQERQSIEQQYGLQAFIGASSIKPKIVRTNNLVSQNEKIQETVAPEITTSSRKQYLETLIERISRNDFKLIVIHGQSGVGKSSLVNAGLIPALEQKVINAQDFLPVVMRVYSDWVEELGRSLAKELKNKGICLSTPLNSKTVILEQLQQNETRNLRTVLIFDQFEEFFFVHPKKTLRHQIYDFLGECLKILSLKVILSLREDYLHYLLNCNRLPSMEVIGNDILSKNVLYQIENFSTTEAKSIIQRLTESSSFYLEPALIDELVQNLADELEEVSPIELQLVGTQLQTEKITTLDEYQKKGSKEKLLGRFLDEAVKNCGPENEIAAWQVLYLLTNENNTRPFKTRAELAMGSKLETDKLDLVLEVLLGTKVVLLRPEVPDDRYQLIHDYLVYSIRQKWSEISEIEKFNSTSQTLFQQHDQLGALIAIVKAAKKLKETEILGDIQIQTVGKLQEVVYAIQERNRFESHSLGVWGVSFSPDGQILASASQDCTVKLWTRDGTLLNTLKDHSDRVLSVSFSPNGQILASASEDRTIKIWSIKGILLKTLEGHSEKVLSVKFSPDGQTIASSSWDHTVKLWRMDGTLFKTLEGYSEPFFDVSFSPDGQTIASSSWDYTVKLWRMDGTLFKTLEGHSSSVLSVSFSPDGQTIASSSWDKTIKLWRRSDGKLLKTFHGHKSKVWSISFSPDGQTLASASWDHTVKLWNYSNTSRTVLKKHNDTVMKVSFSPDGQTLALASLDKTITLWKCNGSLLKVFSGHDNKVSDVHFSPDGKILASASEDRTVKFWHPDGTMFKTFSVHKGGILSISFSPNGKNLAVAIEDGTIELWSLDGNLLKTFSGHRGDFWNVDFSPDGQILASASWDNTVKLWSLEGETSKPKTLQGHEARVLCVSFSPDGQMLASAGEDSTIKLWSLEGELLQTIRAHDACISKVNFSPDGQILASASWDKTVKLWNLNGKLLATFEGHDNWVVDVQFSPDGQTIASASVDRKVILWNLKLDELLVLACNWLRDYLTTSTNMSESDRHICHGIST
ncbi:MAG: hypothetical protein QNJ55_34810 [Xenococcus sp. MO_188.B8]|nr:hypothetical protein [Xenococcus sp. MO_188.B8]